LRKITKTRLALIGVAAAAVLAVAVPAAFAGTTFINGQLSPGDTAQTDRLFRDGIPSQCTYLFNGFPPQNTIGTSKTDPGIFGDGLTRSADVYSFWNATNQFQCVTVRLRTNCGVFDPLQINGFAAAYFFYNPDLTAVVNPYVYAGDAGQSGSPMQFGFGVEPFQTFEVVVSTVDLDLLNCNNYLLTVQIGKTAKTAFVNTAKAKLKPGSYDTKRAHS
jgi:hypothetical protein